MKTNPDLSISPLTSVQVRWLEHLINDIKLTRRYGHISDTNKLTRDVLVDEGKIEILQSLVSISNEQLKDKR